MKKEIVYTVIIICLGLFLSDGIVLAQSGSEVKFYALKHPLNNDTNLVNVSAAINATESVTGDGVHFTLIVKNNSGKAITIKNIVDQLLVALYDEHGRNIAQTNEYAIADINRRQEDRKWKFRSQSVLMGKAYTNGREEKIDLKSQEFIEIPGGGIYKLNLMIKKVKQTIILEDLQKKASNPMIDLPRGKYKLNLTLQIITNDQNKSGGFVASFKSPMIDIDYSN